MRRVAITGVGAVTPLGNDAPSTWSSLRDGRSGIRPLATFDASESPVRIAAQVEGFDPTEVIPDRRKRRYLSRAASFGFAAAVEAITNAGPGWYDTDPYDRGVAMGATVGRPELPELVDMAHVMDSSAGRRFMVQAPGDVLLREPNLGIAMIAAEGDCRGPTVSVSTACAGSAHAIGEAFRHIQDGDCEVMLAGGFDALTSWMDVLGFSLLGALTSEYNDDPAAASRPFDAKRSGFVLGEGAAVFVLEEWEHAVQRGARIRAELAGYGSSLNAYRITDSPPDGGGAISAMAGAIDESGMSTTDIDYVVAHGTGTPGNDLSETVAIKTVLGDHAREVAVSSTKSVAGHLTSAAAALNLVAAIGAIENSVVPPTMNLTHPDPKLDLDYVPLQARERDVNTVLVNAFAFGGTNAAMVVCKP